MSPKRYTPRPAEIPELQPGTEVGPYRIKRLIDAGGMGAVYYAIHQSIGKKVAIKFLHKHVARNQDNIHRFLQEARIVNAIEDPGIVDIFDYGKHKGYHYIVMEYLKGERLLEFIHRNGRLAPFPAAQLLRTIALIMSKVHEKGVVHRDLKAENIFLLPATDGSWPPRLKILDFGLAKLLEPLPGHTVPQTMKGVTLGTPYYMSPEQCKGEPVDHRSDIYAFGVLAYEMITGHLPFWSDDPIEVMEMHISAEPKLYPYKERPRKLDELILGCLEKNPDDRPQSMAEIAYTLELIYPALKPYENWEKIAKGVVSIRTADGLPQIKKYKPVQPKDDTISNEDIVTPDFRKEENPPKEDGLAVMFRQRPVEMVSLLSASFLVGLSLGMLIGHIFF